MNVNYDKSSRDVGDNKVSRNRTELVLASLSGSYSKLDLISIDASGHSFYSILHYLLTIYSTNYYSKKIWILIFLRREFLS